MAISKRHNLLGGSYYETSIPPIAATKDRPADYRLWIPDGVEKVRGLIVKQHGCGDAAAVTGLDHANDLQWQALSLKHQFALLAARRPSLHKFCDDVIDSNPDDVFPEALHDLARKSHHPELDKVPWALWGHSGGADWGMYMLQKYPDRVIAVVAMRCGGVLISNTSELLTSPINSAILGTPVLFALGERDPNVEECLDLPKKVFSRYRKAGALWALAVESNATHESANTRLLAIPYIDAILTARLTVPGTKLSLVNAAQGWLGNTSTHSIAPVKEYKGDPLKAAWFPNEETARKWQQYVTTNAWNRLRYGLCKAESFFIPKVMQHSAKDCYPDKISLAQKPAAPTDLHATRIGKTEALLSWNFSPDLENGLPSFRIYRNKSLIKTLQGQGHDFGDAPEPPHVVLEFRDKEAKDNAIYNVSAFNTLGENVSQPALIEGEQNSSGSVVTLTVANAQ